MTKRTLAYTRTPSGDYTFHHSVSEAFVLTLAEQIIAARFQRDTLISSSTDALAFACAKLAREERKTLGAVFLDQQHRVLHWQVIAQGGLNETPTYPREIIKQALRQNAAAVILAENHVSGVTESNVNRAPIIKSLTRVLGFMEIRLLDYLLIGGHTGVPLMAEGMHKAPKRHQRRRRS